MRKVALWLKLIRPSQQIKNGAVVLGALASGKMMNPENIGKVLVLLISWITISGCVYILNDVSDYENDRKHPRKSFRPIASDAIQTKHAKLAVIPMTIFGITLSMGFGLKSTGTLIAYLIINLLYSWRLKNIVIIDLLVVSSGFVLRGLSGIWIVSADPSVWFILLSVFGSLLLVSGKRVAQKIEITKNAHSHRDTVSKYPAEFLEQIQTICGAGLIISYVLMTQEKILSTTNQQFILELSIIPFLATILFILFFQKQEVESDVTTLLITKKELRLTSSLWLLTFALSLV